MDIFCGKRRKVKMLKFVRFGSQVRSGLFHFTKNDLVMVYRTKHKSSHELKKDMQKFKGENVLSQPQCQEILKRTRVVTDVTESAEIVEEILERGDPVAVDMEGIVNEVTSMIQVCDSKGNISLFR